MDKLRDPTLRFPEGLDDERITDVIEEIIQNLDLQRLRYLVEAKGSATRISQVKITGFVIIRLFEFILRDDLCEERKKAIFENIQDGPRRVEALFSLLSTMLSRIIDENMGCEMSQEDVSEIQNQVFQTGMHLVEVALVELSGLEIVLTEEEESILMAELDCGGILEPRREVC